MKMVKMIFKRLRIKNMYRKILLTQLVFAAIPLTAIAIYMAYTFNRNIITNHEDNISSRLTVATQTIDSKINLYLNRSYLIVNNNYCLLFLRNIIRGEYEVMLDMQSLISALTVDLVPQRSRTTYFKLFVEGYMFDSSIYIESIQSFSDQTLADDILNLTSNQVIWNDNLYIENDKQEFMVFYRNMSDFTVDAFLRVYISYSEIEEVLDQACKNEQNFVVYHTNGAGNVLYFRDNNNPGKQYADFEPDDYLLMSGEMLPDGSFVTIGLNRWSIKMERYANYVLTIIFFIILMLFIFAVTSMTSGRIIKNLHAFIDTISVDENLLLTEFQYTSQTFDDEVAIIKKRFINKLREIESAHKLVLNVRNEKNMLEINLLQSRLNPHMLYNSLSTIRMCAAGNDNQKTMEIVDALSQYYRLALNNGIDVVTVAQELALVKQYVDIVKLTYSKDYKLVVDIEECIYEKMIFKHLIQPVVENALHHGLRGLPAEAVIHIIGSTASNKETGEKMLVFQISDNGFGMDEQTVQKVMSMEYTSSHGGFGIKNLIQKIQLFYGTGSNLIIKSTIGNGVTVTIMVKELNSSN